MTGGRADSTGAGAAPPPLSFGVVRKAITDSYYDTRNEGGTMETAADLAATRVFNLLSQRAASSPAVGLPDRQALIEALWHGELTDRSGSNPYAPGTRPWCEMQADFLLRVLARLREGSGTSETPLSGTKVDRDFSNPDGSPGRFGGTSETPRP